MLSLDKRTMCLPAVKGSSRFDSINRIAFSQTMVNQSEHFFAICRRLEFDAAGKETIPMETKALSEQILQLKKERGITILAHTYQRPEILDVADITGDSFKLSAAAKEIDCETVMMCGVRFMAETVKILSPEKRVILAGASATCPMAEQIPPERVRAFRQENPDALVCAYINTTAALKAECDVCVTSSSAVNIVRQLDAQRILFIPDKNLGAFVAREVPEKELILWDGYCPVHNQITAQDVEAARREHPGALVAMHPECPPEAVALADMVGSTAAIIQFILQSGQPVIVATERGVVDALSLRYPDKKLYQLCPQKLVCEDMKLTTLEGLYHAMRGEGGSEVSLDETLRLRAKKSIDAMLQYGG